NAELVKQLRQLISEARTRLSRGEAKGRRLLRGYRLRKGNADYDSESNYRIAHVMLPFRVIARSASARCADCGGWPPPRDAERSAACRRSPPRRAAPRGCLRR